MNPATSASHAFEDHTGEARVRLEAPSLAELFAEAARALAELMTGSGALVPASGDAMRIDLTAHDREALLVDWLNELIYQAERSHAILTTVARGRVAPGRRRPGAPTAPDVQISRIRLFGAQLRYAMWTALGIRSG